ncbi:MAG: hypothetical protein R2699_00430 [Acidimicrobiales bacterium]
MTGRDDEQYRRSYEAVRRQLAFYGSTPAYAGARARGLRRPAPRAQGAGARRAVDDMAGLVDDDLVERAAVCGEPSAIAPAIRSRLDGISTRSAWSTTARRILSTSPRWCAPAPAVTR